jgi:predicted nicotinamide N-methyase
MEKIVRPKVRTGIITVAGEKFHIGRVQNVDALVDAIDDQQFRDDERLPYWAELWPSAVALSEYILGHRGEFYNKQVLELGSGLGLSGLAAARAGADVLFTDYESDALAMIRVNFKRNFNRQPAVSLFDWREPGFDRRFDIVIASDVLYEQRWLEPVRILLNRCVAPEGFAVIAEPGRSVAVPFFKKIASEGWRDHTESISVWLDGKKSGVIIHKMQKC